MITASFLERYLDIQFQIMDTKIERLKENASSTKKEVLREVKIKAIQLQRRKNKLKRNYQSLKNSGVKGYESIQETFNAELQELCTLYNRLFSQLEAGH